MGSVKDFLAARSGTKRAPEVLGLFEIRQRMDTLLPKLRAPPFLSGADWKHVVRVAQSGGRRGDISQAEAKDTAGGFRRSATRALYGYEGEHDDWVIPEGEYEQRGLMIEFDELFLALAGVWPACNVPDPPRSRSRPRDPTAPEKTERGYVSPRLRVDVLTRDKYCCQMCGARAPENVLVIDHKTSVAHGGLTVLDNLQALCEPCNQGKGARDLDDP